MFKNNSKATISPQHISQPSELLKNQQCQKLLNFSSKILMAILCVSSSAAWLVFSNRAAAATNWDNRLHENRLASLSSGRKRSPIVFEVSQVNFAKVHLPKLLSQNKMHEEIIPLKGSKVRNKHDRNKVEDDTDTQLELKSNQSLPLLKTESIPQTDRDSELGTLRVQEEKVQLPKKQDDSELGTLRVQEQKLQSRQSTSIAHLLTQVGYFQTNNVFSGVDPVEDGLLSTGLTFSLTPVLGSKTRLVAAIDGKVLRYVTQSEFNYNLLRFRADIRQQITPQMYGEVGWNNQQLFSAKEGDRFLNENSLRLALYRHDKITNKLWLNSFYEFRLNSAEPDSRSRIINSLSASLDYYIQPHLHVGLEYQFALSDFTQRQREDEYNLLLGKLTYAPSRDSQIDLQAGVSLGGSSDPNVDFNNIFFSVNYTVQLGKL